MDLIALLEAIADGPVSGEALAARFSVSRAMVWKGVEALRSEGVIISARQGYTVQPGSGFGAASLSWRLGRPVTFLPQCDSTNAHARRMAREGVRQALVVADQQTAGRGRRGRTWQSAPGQNLLFSLLLRPPIPPQHAPRSVLIWAAAMARALAVQLKWPNDLVDAEGRKLGGILAEMEVAGEEVEWVVLGVGVNVNQLDFPALPGATSLRRLRGAPLDRAALLAELLAAIESADISGGSLDPWRAVSRTLGRRVRVGAVEGIAEDVREDGGLIVSGQVVLTGDVELI